MNVLIGVLTTSDMERAVRCVKTSLDQIGHSFELTVKVFVNSRIPKYHELIVDSISDVEVIKTKSNGLPGLGKQSVINWFLANEKYDALIIMDGDDFLYPLGLKVIQHIYDDTLADVIGLQAHDMLYDHKTEFSQVPLIEGYWLVSWFDTQRNLCLERDCKSWLTQVGLQRTPDRLIWFTRKSFHGGVRPWYPINLEIYEDYACSLSCLAAHTHGQLNYVQTTTSAIYVHEECGRSSTCSRYLDRGHKYIDLDDSFVKTINWLHTVIGPFGFNTLPWYEYTGDDNLMAEEKAAYVRPNIVFPVTMTRSGL